MSFAHFKAYTDRLYQIDKAFDDAQPNRLNRHRHLEPDSAEFLASLVISKRAKNILEIGTSTGYSTLWLGYALAQINRTNTADSATLTSIDIDEWRLLTARNHLRTLQFDHNITLQQVDAKDFLRQSTAHFDVISHADEVAAFLSAFEQDNNYLCSTLSIGAGLFVAVRQ